MRPNLRRCCGSWPVAVSAGLASLWLLLLPGGQIVPASAGDEGPRVIRVEQDWQLVLNEPGSDISAPQLHTVMSPREDLNGAYAQVSWNYRELPEFVPGGLQVQAWNSELNLGIHSVGELPLWRDAETITWTQQLETNGSTLTFKIINGRSVSWGQFGGDNMQIVLPVSMDRLNLYSSSVTQSGSWVTYGSNRVSLLQITEVRRYGVDGLLSRDTTPVVVFRYTE